MNGIPEIAGRFKFQLDISAFCQSPRNFEYHVGLIRRWLPGFAYFLEAMMKSTM
jgi:hypothetical protein